MTLQVGRRASIGIKNPRGVRITAGKDEKQQQAKTDLQMQESTESHRYWLAMLIVLSFMVIMIIAVVGTIFYAYTGIANLVGYFSSWIAAIVGFYFLQQNTAGAQAQAKVATDSAATQHARADQESEKRSKLASETGSNINDLEKILNEFMRVRAKEAKPGKALAAEDVQEFQTRVESLSKEATDSLRKARDTIKLYST